MRRKLLHRRSVWGLLIAALLTLVVSGLPMFVAELFGNGEVACATDCSGSDAQKHCPPNCSHGVCGKIVPSVPGPVAVVQFTEPGAVAGTPALAPVGTCHSRDASSEVFHPPRA